MARIKIINRKGSKACRTIREEAGIYMYKGKAKYMPDILVNWGSSGDKLRKFYSRYPSARKIPTINKEVGLSKLRAVNIAKEHEILVPDSKLTLDKQEKKSHYIEKRINSIGGKGIRSARGKNNIPGKYYQEFIKNRIYEIRVHAFEWSEAQVQKRYGKKDEIAWNFSNGGRFQSVHHPETYSIFVRAIDTSKKILGMFGMGFGAVDFLIDADFNLYFIEINSAPGFQALSKDIYINAFKQLKAMTPTQLNKLKCLS
jgi:glutathione synthase/RimK-type ligase-like ATP-grasp enzyme